MSPVLTARPVSRREHIFTHQHSVVGRYMALAEHSFGTIVQRFLSKPHYIRMHYGHPDMVNGTPPLRRWSCPPHVPDLI